MCLDVGYGKMQLVRVSSCRLGAAVLPLRREAFGVGAAWVHLCCKTRLFVQKFYAFSCYFINCLLSGVWESAFRIEAALLSLAVYQILFDAFTLGSIFLFPRLLHPLGIRDMLSLSLYAKE